ncbi:Molybdopterin biosynthesis protein MoeA [uncultured Candidatus Thioglobus sp.]|nr:Molybdopterin biosynthesis protein MoeA [uncultured Candidatus Thioglobus sp.]
MQRSHNVYHFIMDNQAQQPLLTTDEALNFVLDSVVPSAKTQLCSLDDALNQVLAQKVSSNINVPSFDNTAVDGYAVHLQPEQINIPGVLSFKITDRIPAGSIGKTLEIGCAARIFTGAPIPAGANSVIMQEDCELSKQGDSIETWRPILLNENIRPLADDIAKDSMILRTGKQLKPEDIALVASIGVAELKVFQPIKVGVFFTGDELIEPGEPLNEGEIFNSNRYALVALLKQLGCVVVNLGNIKDTLNVTTEALTKLSTECDLIITTGGVSVGEEDYVKPAVEQLGKLSLWRIRMKPGRPLAFGNIGKAVFIGLPGNPVSVMVTFFLFAQPLIKKMQGRTQYKNPTLPVQCNFDWHRARARREFVRVQLDTNTLPPTANLYPKQNSNVLSSMVWADGLVEIPENFTFTKSEVLNYYSFNKQSTNYL